MRKKVRTMIMTICALCLCVNQPVLTLASEPNELVALIETTDDFPDAPKLNVNTTYTYSYGDEYPIEKGVLANQYYNYIRFDLENKGDYVLKWKGTGRVSSVDVIGVVNVYDSDWIKIYDNGKSTNYADSFSTTLKGLSTGTYYVVWERVEYGSLSLTYVNPKSPALNKNSNNIKVGTTYQLKLKNAPLGKINWVSGKSSIASVDKNGKVTAKKAGSANIYAIIDNKCYVCKFKISK